MSIIERISDFKADWIDVGLTKIAVFAATLLIAKLWQPILSFPWYWYLLIFLVAVIRPLNTLYKWTRGSTTL